MDRFVRLKDLHGEDCYVNVSQIRAVKAAAASRRGGSNIIFDSGSSIDVQESPERVVCRCQNAAAVRQMETAY